MNRTIADPVTPDPVTPDLVIPDPVTPALVIPGPVTPGLVTPDPVIPDAQVEAYREKGFVVVEDIFSPDEVARMCEVLDEIVDAARSVRTHDEVYDLEPSHSPERPRVRRIKTPWHVHPLFREMVEHPRLIAVLTRLIGPALRLHGGKINLKSAEYGSPVEWHQDWAFYPHTNDDVLAVGVMLDDMMPDNGPLLIVPGSHRGPTWDHHHDGRFAGAIDPRACDMDARSPARNGEANDRSAGVRHGLLGRRARHRSRRSVQLPSRARGARLGAEHVGARPAAAALRGRGRVGSPGSGRRLVGRASGEHDRGRADHRAAHGAGAGASAVSRGGAGRLDLREPVGDAQPLLRA